jgi:hypothetical protein
LRDLFIEPNHFLTFYVKARFPFLLTLLIPLLSFGADVPENLGLGLKRLVENYQKDPAQFRAQISSKRTAQADAADRVVVRIHLNGSRRLNEVRTALEGLGLEIIHVDPSWREGVISAWLPISEATTAAAVDGIRSVLLAPAPGRRVGSVTAESSVVERAKDVNTPGVFSAQGIIGAGISVGIVSDSYNTSSSTPNANLGVASGDLPGPGNPNGHTTPVVVLQDGATIDTDEGRGMAEIVHDIAPGAKISFQTSGLTQNAMASAIRNLRTNAASQCDIIADDIYFFEEPFFSDGPIAQAIDDVVTSSVLAGKKVVYFSAAGNDGNNAYSSDVNRVTPAAGMAAVDNLNFSGVPASLYAGGFHNLNPGGATKIAMSITTNGGPTVSLQWDDPFDTGGLTTDYNLLVFSSTGSYLSALSGTDNNFSTQEPLELIDLDGGTMYQLVIALGSSAPPTATHLHLAAVSQDDLSSSYIVHDAISIFGHAAAVNANAVGAYVYNDGPDTIPSYNSGHVNPPPGPYRPARESFSSTGGNLSFYFDPNGIRLVTPNIRPKPEFSACDGVNTSFFGDDNDNDNFPNFSGTSASAPTAAAIAALVLQAAGGPGSRTPAQMRTLMEQSTFPHDLNPDVCNATASNGVATVQISANGNTSNDSASSPTFFTVMFSGNPGEELNHLVIDLANTPLVFDTSATGFPFTVGSNPNGISAAGGLQNPKVLEVFFDHTFQPGETISFGIDRDLAAISAGGNSADLLAGAKIKASLDNGVVRDIIGGFVNQLGSGFTFADGFGLIDARRAVASILASPPNSTSIAANISTRAYVGTGDNVLIGGFIVQGPAPKKVIVRALGPSLTASGVVSPLANPALELHDGQGTLIAFDDNWQDDSGQATQIQATGLAPNDPSESALVETLAPALYTAIVVGVNKAIGIALVEIYDLDSQPATSQLANISTRAPVGTGDNVMIGGFIISGSDPTNVLVRALGPSLTGAGVVGALPDPAIELRNGQGTLLATNDDWQQDSLLATQIQATGLAPNNALESAIFTSLSAGTYTAIVLGTNAATGVGLVEVYNLK